MMDPQTLKDLSKTACDRARKAVTLVTQLIDDDSDTAAVLMIVAADMITGAAYNLYQSDDALSEDEALGRILQSVLGTLGLKEVDAAFKAIKGARSCGG